MLNSSTLPTPGDSVGDTWAKAVRAWGKSGFCASAAAKACRAPSRFPLFWSRMPRLNCAAQSTGDGPCFSHSR